MNQRLVTQTVTRVLRPWLCYLSICGHGSEVGAIKTVGMCLALRRIALNTDTDLHFLSLQE